MLTRRLIWPTRIMAALALGILATAEMTAAQAPGQSGDETARAIRELTTEVRALRAAIERTSESQLQGQILGLYATLQQNRVAQASAQLDAARRELEGITTQARDMAQELTNLEAGVAAETDAAKRREIEGQLRAIKHGAENAAAQEQQIRQRESDAYQALQTEEQRWNELIARLEALLKK